MAALGQLPQVTPDDAILTVATWGLLSAALGASTTTPDDAVLAVVRELSATLARVYRHAR